MPRKPLGTYRRTTGDWFQHVRASATIQVIQAGSNGIGAGIFNSDQQGRVCHVLGVTAWLGCLQPTFINGPLSGAYYTSLNPSLTPPDTAFVNPVDAFFDLDPVPNIIPQFGYVPASFVDGNRIIPFDGVTWFNGPAVTAYIIDTGLKFYPDGGVAAFKPGRGFCLYSLEFQNVNFTVSFDFVMLPD